MRISNNHSLLPRIYNANRNKSEALERTNKYENVQPIVIKRNYPFQRSYLHTSSTDSDMKAYNTAKVELLRKNPVGTFIDIYA